MTSLLDTDLYKLTMQNCIFSTEKYRELPATYTFKNRGIQKFTKAAIDEIQVRINEMKSIRLSVEERAFLETKCPYFKKSYLDYLSHYSFNPSQVTLGFEPIQNNDQKSTEPEFGQLTILIEGLWIETILWEVPLMAIISEVYFTTVEKDWDYVGQRELAELKGKTLFDHGILLSEFGTRRRRSYKAQEIVLRGLVQASKEGKGKGSLTGTSNVHFAKEFGLNTIGTIAHEFMMAVAALEGYDDANGIALDRWERCYPTGQLSIALTDTFTSASFFKTFISDPVRARKWKGLRQDSGNALEFIQSAKAAFEQVDPEKIGDKILVFSDGLDLQRCLDLYTATKEAGMVPSFGVGTFLTNDFKKVVENDSVGQSNGSVGTGNIRDGESSNALNMVIKLRTINGKECVKLSDDLGKTTGDLAEVKKVKAIFGLS